MGYDLRNKRKRNNAKNDEKVPKKRRKTSLEDDSVDEDDNENEDSCQFDLYFMPDIDELSEMIYEELPHRKKIKLRDIKKCLTKIDRSLLTEYSTPIPKDTTWKLGLPKKRVIELDPILKKARKILKENKPTMEKILSSNITIQDKVKVIELFDIYKNSVPYSFEEKNISRRIDQIITSPLNISKKEIDYLEDEEKRLKRIVDDCSKGLKYRILTLNANDTIKKRIWEMYQKLETYDIHDQEYQNLKNKIVWAVSLPYHNSVGMGITSSSSVSHKRLFFKNFIESLNNELYGMNEVKDRLLEIVNNRILNPKTKSMLALKGKPGMGKTAIAKALAKACNLPFERISLAGMEDPTIFKGTSNSWLGAEPSIILSVLKRMKTCNGIILFDEIDKLSESRKGKEIQNALLHITDYVQNSEFQDLFLSEFTHDISNIWFMFAMNDDKSLDLPLRDRLDILEVKDYSNEEMINILKDYIFPKTLKEVGLTIHDLKINESACEEMIHIYKNEIEQTGLRPLEKSTHSCVSKINMMNTYISLNDKSIPFQMKLKKFKGFPYHITKSDISKLCVVKQKEHLSMYI